MQKNHAQVLVTCRQRVKIANQLFGMLTRGSCRTSCKSANRASFGHVKSENSEFLSRASGDRYGSGTTSGSVARSTEKGHLFSIRGSSGIRRYGDPDYSKFERIGVLHILLTQLSNGPLSDSVLELDSSRLPERRSLLGTVGAALGVRQMPRSTV
jgi:hypothetical protein